jgi:transcriptional regulator with XRE-family HTH domain
MGGDNLILNKIVSLCKERGISIAKLEADCNFGNATIRSWGKSDPGAQKLKKVADYFGVTVDELLSEEA